jgi:hypothetical protein
LQQVFISKKNAMRTKLAFAAATLIFTTAAFSQDILKKKDGYKKKEFTLPSMDQPIVIKGSGPLRNQHTLLQYQQSREAFLLRIKAEREGQYSLMILPPDNMSCWVPAKKSSAAMPIWKPKQMPENMPNGIKPYKVIPDKKE